MSQKLYEEEIYDIYGIGNKKEKKKDIVEEIDNEEEKSVLVVTNNKDYLGDDCLNIVDRNYSHILKDMNVQHKLVESYVDVDLDETYDEIYIMNVLSSMEFEDHEKLIEYYVNKYLNNNGIIYIQDLCIDNILQYFFSPNQFNDNKVTEDTIKMGLSVIYGGKEYKRRSLIIPSSIGGILNRLNLNDVMMQPRNTMVIIKGTKL